MVGGGHGSKAGTPVRERGTDTMLDTLKALVIDYQKVYGLKDVEVAMQYIREDMEFLADRSSTWWAWKWNGLEWKENDYNIISKGNTNTDTEYQAVQA